MTDQQSLNDIKMLLLTYPGISSAVVFRIPDRHKVRIRFRCANATSLRSIAACSVWANVQITLGDPDTSICAEPEGVSDLPCDIEIPDEESEVPTQPERFGVYLSDDLEAQGLISAETLQRLHSGWNACLHKRRRDT